MVTVQLAGGSGLPAPNIKINLKKKEICIIQLLTPVLFTNREIIIFVALTFYSLTESYRTHATEISTCSDGGRDNIE